ncbi:hypothetical protein BJ508DRAFT_113393 [Ascobolus immersus RN42]|uniref:DUF7918 domain-containing protein n=1 Tax=Ascobolus immersus RN42 TaxID=1160509 RepID=A0A3N4I5G1_ASCIM|nr:hypothetical protein BJ508DRAFT_113393 [Ascobolus immersus RN42]
MVVYNGFNISIVTANGPLREYPFRPTSTLSPPNTKTVYVEVPSPSTDSDSDSQPFTIQIKPVVPRPSDTVGDRFHFSLDGFSSANGKSIGPSFPSTLTQGVTFSGFSVVDSSDNDRAIVKEMFFEQAQLELGGGEEALNDKLGVVEVCFRELDLVENWKGTGTAPLRNDGPRPVEVVRKDMLAGDSARGLSHVTRIGGALDKPRLTAKQVTPKWEAPEYTVRFVYRSRAALRSLGVEVEEEVRRENVKKVASGGCGLPVGRWVKRLFGKKEKKEMRFSEKK